MSYHPGDRPSGLRYREEGIELRCETCRGWWPLTDEFWTFKQTFRRCRACIREDKNRRDRERNKRPEVRAARIAYQLAYRQEAGEVKRLKAAAAYWADPDAERAKAKAYYYANRETVLAKRKERYVRDRARKAA